MWASQLYGSLLPYSVCQKQKEIIKTNSKAKPKTSAGENKLDRDVDGLLEVWETFTVVDRRLGRRLLGFFTRGNCECEALPSVFPV